MKLESYTKELKIDGTLTFEFKELGKMHRTTKDITMEGLRKLLKENKIPDGVYVIRLLDKKWIRIIYWRNEGRYSIETYQYDVIPILEGKGVYEARLYVADGGKEDEN